MPMMVHTKHAARARSMHRTVLKGMIAALVLAATLGACSTVAPHSGTVATANPAVAQAAQLARSGASLSGAARQANDNEIDRLLSQLDDASLSREAAALPVGEPLYNYAGRALLRRGLALPRPFDRTAWKFNAGQRPPAESDGYRPPVKLAVLLPLSGNLAVAASPVRDGLLAGYYGEQRRRPDVVFYDTVGTAEGTLAAYDKAVAEGSDFVVGPLGRDEVGALYGKGTLPVPVLALNRIGTEPPSGNASFSLSPEDEGLAAAEYLLDLNAKRVLVVGGADETQRRAVAALRGRLGERGAVVTDVASEGTSDFVPYASKDGGVDAVFLAVRGPSARTLMPRLAAAGLGRQAARGDLSIAVGHGQAHRGCGARRHRLPERGLGHAWRARPALAGQRRHDAADRQGSGRAPVRVRLRRLADQRVSRIPGHGQQRAHRGRDRHAAPGRLRQRVARAGVVDIPQRRRHAVAAGRPALTAADDHPGARTARTRNGCGIGGARLPAARRTA
jgi:outer membrane PBP1 activator LpoA protein